MKVLSRYEFCSYSVRSLGIVQTFDLASPLKRSTICGSWRFQNQEKTPTCVDVFSWFPGRDSTHLKALTKWIYEVILSIFTSRFLKLTMMVGWSQRNVDHKTSTSRPMPFVYLEGSAVYQHNRDLRTSCLVALARSITTSCRLVSQSWSVCPCSLFAHHLHLRFRRPNSGRFSYPNFATVTKRSMS